MTRTLSAGLQAAIAAEQSAYVWLLQFEFSGGTIYWTTSPMDIAALSQTWVGIGGVLRWTPPTETGDPKGQGTTFTVSGVNQTIVSAVLGQNYIGRQCRIHLCHLDSDLAVIDTLEVFRGYMNGGWEADNARAGAAGGKIDVSMRASSYAEAFNRRAGILCNPTSHRRHYAGQTFFDKVATIANREIYWGRDAPHRPNYPPWYPPPYGQG